MMKIKKQKAENCLGAAQIKNKITHLEKNKIDVDTLKEDQKEFVKNNKIILKTKQIYKCERHNLFTEEFNKIDSGPSKDKRIQSIDVV